MGEGCKGRPRRAKPALRKKAEEIVRAGRGKVKRGVRVSRARLWPARSGQPQSGAEVFHRCGNALAGFLGHCLARGWARFVQHQPDAWAIDAAIDTNRAGKLY